MGGSLLGQAGVFYSNKDLVGIPSLVGAVVSQWGLKPIIAKAIRKKGGAPDLEKELENIIDGYEKHGVVPYGVTVGAAQNTGGTFSSEAYNQGGMHTASYAPESARDKYLRLLAERSAQKEAAALEQAAATQE